MTYCDDTECQYYNPAGCTASEIYHSTDRFCVTGRRKQRDDHAELMRVQSPNCDSSGGKYKSNRVTLLK